MLNFLGLYIFVRIIALDAKHLIMRQKQNYYLIVDDVDSFRKSNIQGHQGGSIVEGACSKIK